MIRDVAEADFTTNVIERSHEVPVVVDFWASWCGPCRQLTPALEAEAGRREGEIDLAKVDVDANQGLAGSFRVQGIPAVKAFRDGEVVSEFTGALPPAKVAEFFDSLVPSEADRLAAETDVDSLRKALQIDPSQSTAAVKLARILSASDAEVDRAEAKALLEPLAGDFEASGLLAALELREAGESEEALKAWAEGDQERALKLLEEEISPAKGTQKDRLRRVMVAIFTELGPASELAREHRRRLATLL